MFCQHCGAPSGPDDVFCKSCGQPLQSPDAAGQTQAPSEGGQAQPVATQPPVAAGPQPVAAPPQAAGQPKKKTGRIIGISVAVVLVLALGIFLAYRFLGDRITGETSEETTRLRPKTTEAVLEPLALGQTGLHDGLALTVDWVSRPNADYLYGEAQEDAEHVLVWLTIENRSRKEKDTPDPSQFFLLEDADWPDDRIAPDQDTYYDDVDELPGGLPLLRGEAVSGWLLFQKPKDLKTATLHYHAGRTSREPDLIFTFPINLEDLPDPDDPDPSSSETSTEPTVQDLDLFDYLPGQWVSMPDEDHMVYISVFTDDGFAGSSFGYSQQETNLDRWMDDDIWYIDEYYWQGWYFWEQDLGIGSDEDIDFWFTVEAVDDHHMILTDMDTEEAYEVYRMDADLSMAVYLYGIWVPNEPDDEGIHAALSFEPDGTVQVIGSVKLDDDAALKKWGDEELWEIIGSFEGSWWIDDEALIIELDDDLPEAYSLVRYSPDEIEICQDDSWYCDYTRVYYPPLFPED